MNRNTMIIGLVISALVLSSAVAVVTSDSEVDAVDVSQVVYSTDGETGTVVFNVDTTGMENPQIRLTESNQSGQTLRGQISDGVITVTNARIANLDGVINYLIYPLGGGTGNSYAEGTFTIGTISFDGNGAEGTMDSVRAGGTYTVPACGFTAPEGSTFDGWMHNGTMYEPGSTIEVTGNITLTAQWSSTGTDVPVESIQVTGPDAAVAGTESTYTATVIPDDATDKTVTWSTSNDIIASVDQDGNVTFHEPGTVRITATANNGVSGYIDVTVTDATMPVSEVVVTGSTTATVGSELSYTATVRPDDATDKSVTWSTNNSDVATVDQNGNVTFHTSGTVRITATANNGVSGSITVTVSEAVIPVTGVTITGSQTAIEDTSGTYTATVTPDNATDRSVTWSTSDDTVATVDQNGKVRFLTPGPVIITATAGGVSGSITVEVSERSPESISAVVGVYDEGDTFNWDDVTVTVHYDNGQSETITDGFTIDLADGTPLDTSGNIETTVHYNGMDCTLDVTVRAPGQVAITVNVVGGGLFGGAVLYWNNESKPITTYGTILVDEGTQVTLSCDGLFTPTVTVDGQFIEGDYTFPAVKDMTFMVVFPTDDDDDDEPVNPSTPVQDGDDDSTTYIVAIAAAAVVAILAALILMQTRKS